MRNERAARIALGLLTVVGLQLGLWAAFAPQSFYDDFPGGGRAWVAVNGPYNERLVRDFGSLNLGLAVVTGAACWFLGRRLAQTAAVAYLVYQIPHYVYHLRHLDVYDDASDKVANVVALGLSVVLPVIVLMAARADGVSGSSRSPREGARRGSRTASAP